MQVCAANIAEMSVRGMSEKTGPKFRKGGGDVEKVKKRMNHAPWQKYVRVVEEIRAQASSQHSALVIA